MPVLRAASHSDAGELSVGAFLSGWLAHTRARVRASTYDGYESLIRCRALPSIGGVRLRELHPLQLLDMYARLMVPRSAGGPGLSGGTVRNLHLVLAQALGQAVRWQLIAVSPAPGAQPPRPRRPHRYVVDPPFAAGARRRQRWSARDSGCACGVDGDASWRDPRAAVGRCEPGHVSAARTTHPAADS